MRDQPAAAVPHTRVHGQHLELLAECCRLPWGQLTAGDRAQGVAHADEVWPPLRPPLVVHGEGALLVAQLLQLGVRIFGKGPEAAEAARGLVDPTAQLHAKLQGTQGILVGCVGCWRVGSPLERAAPKDEAPPLLVLLNSSVYSGGCEPPAGRCPPGRRHGPSSPSGACAWLRGL